MKLAECWLPMLYPLPDGIRVGWRHPGVNSDDKLVVRGEGEELGRFRRVYWGDGVYGIQARTPTSRRWRSFKECRVGNPEERAVEWILGRHGLAVDWAAAFARSRKARRDLNVHIRQRMKERGHG